MILIVDVVSVPLASSMKIPHADSHSHVDTVDLTLFEYHNTHTCISYHLKEVRWNAKIMIDQPPSHRISPSEDLMCSDRVPLSDPRTPNTTRS